MNNRLSLMGGACLAAAVLVSPAARASCGTASCPIDLNALNRPTRGGFTAELAFESIDQNQPRIGTHNAAVGELTSPDHDEVRTVNRTTTLVLRYALTDRIHLSALAPFVSRAHDHLASSHGHSHLVSNHNVIPESWDVRGTGDLVLQGRARVRGSNMNGLWVVAGVKLPTGNDDVTNDAGERAESSLQPGSGSTDLIAGLAWESGFVAGGDGNATLVPLFVSATVRTNGRGTDGYRAGNELQLSAGTAYPVLHRMELLLQANARIRERDQESGSDDPFTGGSAVYVSPGVRVTTGAHAALYALVQLPVYQDVNGIQLASRRNYVGGVQWRF